MRSRRWFIVASATLLLAVGLIAQHQRRESLAAAVSAGRVKAEIRGTGASTGDALELTVQKTQRAGGEELTLYVEPGTRLGSSNTSEQSMIIAAVSGRLTAHNQDQDRKGSGFVRPVAFQSSYIPESEIVLTDSSAVRYVLEAYCAEFEKDNPSSSTTFSLGRVDENFACIVEKAKERRLEPQGTQAAIWIYTDNVTYQQVKAKFPVELDDWNAAKAVIHSCGLN